MHRLFVYGTLRHPPLLAALVGRDVAAEPAVLAGHRAAPMAGRAYPGLVVDARSTVDGALVEVDHRELAVLDDFEGPEYTRTAVVVDVAVDRAPVRVEAHVYLLTGPSRSLAGAGVWSLAEFVAGEADRWVGGADPGAHHPLD